MRIFPRGISIAGVFLLVAAGLLAIGGTISLVNPYLLIIPYYFYFGFALACIFLAFLGRSWITFVGGIVLGPGLVPATRSVINFKINDSFDPAIVVSIAIIWVFFIVPMIMDRPRKIERTCDVCNTEGQITTVARDSFCRAVSAGFDPFSRGLVSNEVRSKWSDPRIQAAVIGDLASRDAFQNWKAWVMKNISDWGLCSKCHQNIRSFL